MRIKFSLFSILAIAALICVAGMEEKFSSTTYQGFFSRIGVACGACARKMSMNSTFIDTGAGVMTGLATEVSNPKKKNGARQKSFALIYNQGICPRMCIRADELERAKQKKVH